MAGRCAALPYARSFKPLNQPRRPTISPSNTHIEDPLYAAATAHPAALAVVTPTQHLTYAVLDQLAAEAAARLRALGVAPGQRVGLALPNVCDLVVLVLGAMRAGAVACPLSMRVPPQGVADLLHRASASLLITARDDLAGALPQGLTVVPPEVDMQRDEGGSLPEPPTRRPPLALDQAATIVFTSGSTGTAKAALQSVGNHYRSAEGSNTNIALALGDRWLLALPLNHVGGLGIVFRCVLAGATLVVPARSMALGAAIRHHGITHLSLVATQLGRLLQEEAGHAPAGLKAVLVGGSAVPPSLVREAHQRGYPIHTTYGLTEMTSQVTTTPPGASLDRLATAGRCLPYRQLRLSAAGEILVRGAVLFQGYAEGDRLHQPWDADGWFHTGDLGALDTEGFLRVLGRMDNLFISGGENIHPEEVEQALCTLDAVQQAVVVPVDDAEFGQRPVAFVQAAEGLPDPERLVAHLEALLPRFKIPLAFYPWPADAPPGLKVDRVFFRRLAAWTHRAEK